MGQSISNIGFLRIDLLRRKKGFLDQGKRKEGRQTAFLFGSCFLFFSSHQNGKTGRTTETGNKLLFKMKQKKKRSNEEEIDFWKEKYEKLKKKEKFVDEIHGPKS